MSNTDPTPRDEYGVALFIFGRHDQDFFPLLGRVIALASVIEYQSRTAASRILTPADCSVWKDQFSKVSKLVLKHIRESDTTEELAQISEFTQDARVFADQRASYAHGLVPSVSLESPDQVTAWRSKPGTTHLGLGADLAVLRADVRRGSELVERWNNSVLPVINKLPVLQPEGTLRDTSR